MAYVKPINPDYPRFVNQVIVTLTGDQNLVNKWLSTNYKCGLFFDGTNLPLKTYSFDRLDTGTATLVDTINPNRYTGISLTNSSTTFDVSDDCKAIRINNIILHKHTDNIFYNDTLPVGVTSLVNPAFSADFSVLVTDSAVYTYTPKTA